MQIKGSVLRSRLALVAELAAAEGPSRVLGRLSEDDRRVLAGLLPASWYPFDLGRRLDAAIVDELGGGQASFFEKLGEASAQKNLGPNGVHHGFLVTGDPHAFLAQTPVIYAFYYDRGRRDYERAGDNAAVLTTHDAETFSAPDCATVVGWYRQAVAMCGGRNVRVVEEECRAKGAHVCRYRLTWE